MPPRGGLIRHRDFRLLWTGDTISQLGSQVTEVALPLLAVTTLGATTFEVGLLVSMLTAAFLLVGLPAGAWVDRMRRRPLMIVCDLGRAVLLGTLPLAAALDVLSLPLLYAVALLTGVFTVFFDVAYQSYLPSLVGRDALVEGNARLQASQSVAAVAGPTIGGFLVQALTAPYAVLVDALSFLGSAAFLSGIRAREERIPRAPDRHLRREIGEGLRFVLGHRILRAITGCTATYNFFSSALLAVIVVFLVRDLGSSAGTVGLLYSIGSVGALAGALVAGRAAGAIGSARAIWVSVAVTTPFAFLMPFAGSGAGLAVLAVAWFVIFAGGVVYNVTQVSYRQALCPPHLLGRMNATIRFIVWGTMPLGGLAGGALGTWLGNRAALWVIATGMNLSILWLLASPLRTAHDLPAIPREEAAPAG